MAVVTPSTATTHTLPSAQGPSQASMLSASAPWSAATAIAAAAGSPPSVAMAALWYQLRSCLISGTGVTNRTQPSDAGSLQHEAAARTSRGMVWTPSQSRTGQPVEQSSCMPCRAIALGQPLPQKHAVPGGVLQRSKPGTVEGHRIGSKAPMFHAAKVNRRARTHRASCGVVARALGNAAGVSVGSKRSRTIPLWSSAGNRFGAPRPVGSAFAGTKRSTPGAVTLVPIEQTSQAHL